MKGGQTSIFRPSWDYYYTFTLMIPDMVVYQMNLWDHVIAVIICILAPVLAITSRRLTTEEIKLEPDELTISERSDRIKVQQKGRASWI